MIWVFYIIGWLLHLLSKAALSVGSGINGVKGYRQYFSARLVPIVVRVGVAGLFFAWWCERPDLFDTAAKAIATNLQPGMIRSVIEKVNLPLNIATAGLFGYAADSALDKLALLFGQKEIPKINGAGSAPPAA